MLNIWLCCSKLSSSRRLRSIYMSFLFERRIKEIKLTAIAAFFISYPIDTR